MTYATKVGDNQYECEKPVALSPEWLVNCDTWNSACNGGSTSMAHKFVQSDGVVNESCLP